MNDALFGRLAESMTQMDEIIKGERQPSTEIKQAIAEADAGDFASDEEVATKMKKWGANAS